METKTFEELDKMRVAGQIGWVEFVQQSEYAEKYAEWLRDRGEEADEDNAEFFFDLTDMNYQTHDNEDYGV